MRHRTSLADAIAAGLARKPHALPIISDPADLDNPEELDFLLRRIREMGLKPRFRVKAGSRLTNE